MDELLEKGVVRFFPKDECLQRMVRREFLKSEDQGSKVDTLAIMAIKSIMCEKSMIDVHSEYIYKLIFKEPLPDIFFTGRNKPPTESENLSASVNDWDEIRKIKPIWMAATSEEEEEPPTDCRKAQLRQMRCDGTIMFEIVSQYLPQGYYGPTRVILSRNTVRIWFEYYDIAEIPHRDGMEFDTYWVEKFFNLFISKRIDCFVIDMIGEGLSADQLNSDYMFNFLHDSIIDKYPRKIPAEGWDEYMRRRHLVYVNFFTNEDDFNGDYFFQFNLTDQTEGYSDFEDLRWDYFSFL